MSVSGSEDEADLEREDKLSPLMIACKRGYLETATALLADGAPINAASPTFRVTPLLLATAGGFETIVSLLLDQRARPLEVNVEGDSALLLACYHGHLAIARRILAAAAVDSSPAAVMRQHASSDGMTGFLHATEQGHEHVVHWILDSCVEPADLIAFVNHNNHSGLTALHFAIGRGTRSVFDRLLVSGARVDTITDDGFCQLLLAVQEGDVAMTDALLRHGANPNAQDAWSHNSCLLLAIESGNAALVALLLAADGINLAASNKDGLTAAMMAKQKGDATILSQLAPFS